MGALQVLKIGGNQVDEPDFLAGLVKVLKTITQPTIIVHGGGKEISQLQTAFQIQPQYIDGLRVTDEASLHLVKMALCGAVNTRLVELFNLNGIEAQGLSGLDRGLIRATKLGHPKGDLQRVGEATSVRTDILQDLLAKKVLPVIAPICLGDDGAFNVNADYVAGAVAGAVGASQVVFLTNIHGVMQADTLIPTLTPATAQTLIDQGVISGGMIPKVQTALEVLKRGAGQARITDLEGLQHGTGTTLTLE